MVVRHRVNTERQRTIRSIQDVALKTIVWTQLDKKNNQTGVKNSTGKEKLLQTIVIWGKMFGHMIRHDRFLGSIVDQTVVKSKKLWIEDQGKERHRRNYLEQNKGKCRVVSGTQKLGR